MRNLFFDNRSIWEMHNLQRILNQPEKHLDNPIIKPDRPWEDDHISLYGSAIYEPKKKSFKLWYRTKKGNQCYAISSDGLHFEKPDIGLVEYQGSKKNNILFSGSDKEGKQIEEMTVLYEPDDPDTNRRYKLFFFEYTGESCPFDEPGKWFWPDKGDGVSVAFSSDGLKWNRYEKNPVLPVMSDTTQSVVYDPHCRRYLAYGRFRKFSPKMEWLGLRHADWGRAIACTQSEDFIHWSEPELVLEVDGYDKPMQQIYGMSVLYYEGGFIGMPWIYNLFPFGEKSTGNIDIQLAYSSNGIAWQRIGDRQVFLPNGEGEAWDAGIISLAASPVVLEDKIYIYYKGFPGLHDGPTTTLKEIPLKSMLGLATLRRDGFVSLDAGWEEGTLLTKGRSFSGDLYLNVEAIGGIVEVALCGADRQPLAGFERSDPITGDHLKAKVSWQGKGVNSAGCKEGLLRIFMRRAKLYSYWFT